MTDFAWRSVLIGLAYLSSCNGLRTESEDDVGVFAGSGEDWMSSLNPDTTVNMLSIPGSHDTLTSYELVSAPGYEKHAICNEASVTDLLKQGIRALDFRFGLSDSETGVIEKELDIDAIAQHFESAYRTGVVSPEKGSVELNPLKIKDDVNLHELFGEALKTDPNRPGVRLAKGASIVRVGDKRLADLLRQWKNKESIDANGDLKMQLAQILKPGTSLTFDKGDLVAYHGMFHAFDVDLVAALGEVKAFLQEHPSEFVLVFVKEEKGSGVQEVVAQQVHEFAEVVKDWGSQNSVPASPSDWGTTSLRSLQGKIVLVGSDKSDSYADLLAGRTLHKYKIYPDKGSDKVFEKSYDLNEPDDKMSKLAKFWKSQKKKIPAESAFGVALNINAAAWGKLCCTKGTSDQANGVAGRGSGAMCGSLFSSKTYRCDGVDVLAKEVNAAYGQILKTKEKGKFVAGLTMMDFPTATTGPELVNTIIGLN